MNDCSFCDKQIPETCPSDDFCSSICQQQWMESNADWPTWAYSWNGKNRKNEQPKTPYVPYMPYGNGM